VVKIVYLGDIPFTKWIHLKNGKGELDHYIGVATNKECLDFYALISSPIKIEVEQ
jgi:hypothetical protein